MGYDCVIHVLCYRITRSKSIKMTNEVDAMSDAKRVVVILNSNNNKATSSNGTISS